MSCLLGPQRLFCAYTMPECCAGSAQRRTSVACTSPAPFVSTCLEPLHTVHPPSLSRATQGQGGRNGCTAHTSLQGARGGLGLLKRPTSQDTSQHCAGNTATRQRSNANLGTKRQQPQQQWGTHGLGSEPWTAARCGSSSATATHARSCRSSSLRARCPSALQRQGIRAQ